MPRNAKNVDHIDKVYRELKDLYDDGDFPSELYNKGLLALAFEYMALDDVNSTIQMVGECEKIYITTIMSAHMDDDPKFKYCITRLVELIEAAGLDLKDIVDDDEAFWLSRYKNTGGKGN